MLKEVRDKIIAFREEVNKLTEFIMSETGGVQPSLAILKQVDGKYQFGIVANIHEVFDDQNKEPFIQAIKFIIKQEKPIAIAIITEAWVVKRDIGSPDIEGTVSQQPDKIEAVHAQIETADSEAMSLWELMRDKEQPYLILREHTPLEKKSGNHQGRFTDLLKENYEEFHGKLVDTITNNLN
jgi:hypothetical protein